MTPHATLSEYSVPLEQHAAVVANVERPDHTMTTLAMPEVEPGVYEASMIASMSGIYRFNVIASGVNYKGVPFTREQLLTGSVFRGGDTPVKTDDGAGSTEGNCCRILTRIAWVGLVLLILILLAILRR
jgi:hypothetical protein